MRFIGNIQNGKNCPVPLLLFWGCSHFLSRIDFETTDNCQYDICQECDIFPSFWHLPIAYPSDIRPIASPTCQQSLFAILAWAKATSVSVSLAPTCQSSLTHLPAWAWTTTVF